MRKIRRKSGGISFIAAMIYICFVVVAVLCLTKYANINKQKERLVAENSSLIAQSESLADELTKLRSREELGKDDAYIESVARSQLDMVYPGEVIFRVSED